MRNDRSRRTGITVLGTLMLALSASCGIKVSVELDGRASSWFDAQSYLDEHPLPAGYVLAKSPARRTLSFRLSEGSGGSPTGRVVSRRWLACPVPFGEGPLSVDSRTALSLGLMPLAAIGAPYRAASIDGLFPGQEGYPFEERVVLELEGKSESALDAWFESLPATGAKPVVLGAVGDMIVHEKFQGRLDDAGGDPSVFFGDTIALLRSFDYLIGNLEGPVSTRGTGNPIKKYQFRHRPSVLKAFAAAGVDHFAFANNHTLDFGLEAFLDTLDAIDALGAGRSGAGRDLAEASAPYRTNVGGHELSLFAWAGYPVESRGYSPAHAAAGPSNPGILTDAGLLRSSIAEEAALGRMVIVIAHAGYEYVTTPHPAIRALYRSFAEAGASLVLGGHPHVLQGMESHDGATIAYSLGNFVFIGLDEDPPAQRSGVFSFLLYDGKVRGWNFTPAHAGNEKTNLVPQEHASAATAYFMSLVQALASDGTGK